jgi:putative inorganic carbon (hco3(-)) transporter
LAYCLLLDSKTSALERAAFCCAFGSASATLFSIAVSQILLALSLAALLLSGARLRFPPIVWPLGLFALGTLVSLALSPDPAAGRPQVRKFFVYLVLLAVFSTFRRLRQARWLVYAWVGIGAASALSSFWQFGARYRRAAALGRDFYTYYVGDRITGFMSHWMTFSGMQLTLLVLGAALLFWGVNDRRIRFALCAACGLIGLSILLSWTRGIWIATGAAGLYLLWYWKRWTVAAAPVALVLIFLAGPASLRTRLTSFVRPQGTLDSNQHRIVTWSTGVEMIKAHPWFGLGPEMVKAQFDDYVPAGIPRPLPEGWYGHLHNIYLQYAAERGIPTMLMLLWLVLKCLWDWGRALRGLPPGHEARWLLHGAFAAMVGVMITGIFEHNLGDSEVLLLVLTVVSLGYMAREHAIQPA